MAITQEAKARFAELKSAFLSGKVLLAECSRDGSPVMTLAVVEMKSDQARLRPLGTIEIGDMCKSMEPPKQVSSDLIYTC